MAHRLAVTSLNASTIDIINTIRANASYEYQSLVPEITKASEIPQVGEVLYGYPALANQFLNSLINRIALVKVNSALFNNAYKELKKGYLEFGETVEEVFVNIAKAREFSAEKAAARELKRSLPDVRSAMHIMNWRVQYPVTIQDEDLRMAFVSAQGVQDLIAKIVDSLYTANEYDEYLLFKYLIIKSIAHGKMYPVEFDVSDTKNAAKAFRGTSNMLTFMSTKYNAAGVTTTSPKEDQYIFMDAQFNADYGVDVLAYAFNWKEADYEGKLMLIDDFTTFDNERFAEIRANSDMIEEVTAAELALMAKVKAVLVDKEWFQIYDNLNKFTEVYVSSGLYWNYNYNVWKTVSFSPFSNAVVFLDSTATSGAPSSIQFTVSAISDGADAIVYTLEPADSAALTSKNFNFVQDEDSTEAGIAVHKYGAIIMPKGESAETEYTGYLTIDGTLYVAGSKIYTESDATASPAIVATAVGDTITFTPAT